MVGRASVPASAAMSRIGTKCRFAAVGKAIGVAVIEAWFASSVANRGGTSGRWHVIG